MKIRVAVKEDSAAIGKVHVDSWRTTYKGIVPDDVLEKMSYEQQKEQWDYILTIDHVIVLVAEVDGKIVAYASAGPFNQQKFPRQAGLSTLYSLEEYQGQGIGRALVKEMFTMLQAQGISKVMVEVLKDNKSKYFYEKYGAVFLHNTYIEMGGSPLTESIYVWPSIEDALKKL